MAIAVFPASNTQLCEPLNLPALSWAFCAGLMGIVAQLWPVVFLGGLVIFVVGVSEF